MIKKVLSLTLAAIMIFCMFSMNASAASAIKRIDVDFNAEIAGMTAYDYQKIYTINTKNVGYLDYFEGDNGIYIYEGSKYIGYATLENGKSYNFKINMRSYADIDKNVEVYINGKKIDSNNVSITKSVDPKGDKCTVIQANYLGVKVTDSGNFFTRFFKAIANFFGGIGNFFKSIFK